MACHFRANTHDVIFEWDNLIDFYLRFKFICQTQCTNTKHTYIHKVYVDTLRLIFFCKRFNIQIATLNGLLPAILLDISRSSYPHIYTTSSCINWGPILQNDVETAREVHHPYTIHHSVTCYKSACSLPWLMPVPSISTICRLSVTMTLYWVCVFMWRQTEQHRRLFE